MSIRATMITGLAGALASGVTAVVYLNFSARVMPRLSRLANPAGIAKMQSFNRTAVQAPFMICFFGAAAAGVYLIVRVIRGHHARADVLAAIGGGLYLLGFLLTVAYNVPLNDKLARLTASDPSSVRFWRDYLSRWTTANSVRAALSTAATLLLAGAAVDAARSTAVH